ncbi:MAG: sigma-54-dependent Fis family transcriptional regulator [Deltaproteobacteria bacterium]|nr:sigma-54-dependent Fis family transcriptional regulator [Deltaproteobacteria bacterium]
MSRVLVVDDEAALRFTLSEAMTELGHEVVAVADGEAALGAAMDADVVITDLSMPGMDGLALLERLRAMRPALPVILLTARGSERAAVQAMKAGAHDYLAKPFDLEELGLVVERALTRVGLERRERRASVEVGLGGRVVGEHPAMQRLFATIARVADRDVPVLVQGETGTGKELVATLLHEQSPRRAAPLVRFSCAAIPLELAESELFGHARGAFTGAHQARKGFFAQARGGTLVLDEVAELPLPLQAKLLRALQSGEIQPVGAGRVEHVDVRIVASTHRDLEAEVRAGRFREDLYYHLAVVVLRVPSLRERASDVPALARALAGQHARKLGVEGTSLSEGLVEALARRSWPGNVRELSNAVARLMALADGGEIGPEALEQGAEEAPVAPAGEGLRARLDALERELLSAALAEAGGNQSEAARRLALSRPTFIARAKRFGILG